MAVSHAPLKLSPEMVDSNRTDITTQINVFNQDIRETITNSARSIEGGSWQGNAATDFVSKVRSETVQQLSETVDLMNAFVKKIDQAVQIVNQADAAAAVKADSLNDVYSRIL